MKQLVKITHTDEDQKVTLIGVFTPGEDLEHLVEPNYVFICREPVGEAHYTVASYAVSDEVFAKSGTSVFSCDVALCYAKNYFVKS